MYPEARALFTGGSGTLFNQQYKEADIIDEFFAGLGYSGEKLLFENESRNTYENALFGKKLIQPKFGENWILITSAFHMPRSMGSFCRQGWPLIPYPVDHGSQKGNLLRVDFDFRGNLSGLSTAIHEWVGLLAYYLTDKTSRLFPGPTDFCS